MKNSKDFKAGQFLQFLISLSPFLIIGTMIFSFLIMGVLQFNYYSLMFESKLPVVGIILAVLLPIVTQIGRLSFGLVGARDIASGHNWTGILGLIGGIAIAGFEHYEAIRMAALWNPDLKAMFLFINWISIVAEIRLMMTINKLGKDGFFSKIKTKESADINTQNPELEFDYSPNGNGHH
jgi:hypothetical protein